MAQTKEQKISIQTCIIVPEACPGEFELTCDCCKYSDREFLIKKPEPGTGQEFGSVTCRYSPAR